MTEEYKQDLDKMLADVKEVKVKAFDNLRYYMGMSVKELEESGYRNLGNAEVMRRIYIEETQKVEKIIKTFLKKWPDSK